MHKSRIALLLHWAGADRYLLLLSVICALISSVSSIVPYLGFYRIIDAVYAGNSTRELLIDNGIVIASSLLIRFLFAGAAGIFSHKGAYNTLFKVRCLVTKHMAHIPLGYLDDRSTGEIKTVLNENIEKLELFLAHQLPDIVMYLSGPIVIFVYLCTVNAPLALISLIPLVIAIVVMGVMFIRSMSMMDQANNAISSMNSSVVEYVGGMKLIKAFNMGSRSFGKYSDAIDDNHSLWTGMSRKLGPLYAAYIVALECGLLFLVPLGGRMFMNGSIAASTFILFAFVGSLFLTEIRPLQETGTNFAWVVSAVTQVQKILDTPCFEGGGSFPESCEIEFRDVSFAYGNGPDILKNCDLKIAEGEKVALVGVSGAGKTTAVQLISRFYDVTGGEVVIGGRNVRDIEYERLLENISIVFQKSFLTRDSVLANIRMGLDASLEEVRAAAARAQIDRFVMGLPDGYDTLVGSYGSRFSGGEKQRIAIARAILKDAPILILDEATSAADPENQLEIDRAIQNLCEGKTVIIVAHRLGIVQSCDRVAVVAGQGFECIGTHNEVLAQSSYYRKAWGDYRAARSIVYGGKGGNLV